MWLTMQVTGLWAGDANAGGMRCAGQSSPSSSTF